MQIFQIDDNNMAWVSELDVDLMLLGKWYPGAGGYLYCNIKRNDKRTVVKLHRLVAERMGLGPVSFKDGNPHNCCRDNLIDYINHGPHTKGTKNSATNTVGVYTIGDKYFSLIWNKSDRHYLGIFATLEEAKAARDKALSETAFQGWK